MMKYSALLGIIIIVFVSTLLIIGINNKKRRYVILIGPFILAGMLYFSIFLLTKDMPPNVCDGGALMGLLISFVFLAIGVLLNIINILYCALTYIKKI